MTCVSVAIPGNNKYNQVDRIKMPTGICLEIEIASCQALRVNGQNLIEHFSYPLLFIVTVNVQNRLPLKTIFAKDVRS